MELDLTKPLVPQFYINGCIQMVECEGLPRVCFHVVCTDMSKEECQKNGENMSKHNQSESRCNNQQHDKSPYRPWMLVIRRKPRDTEGR